jgi:hypothetical protein
VTALVYEDDLFHRDSCEVGPARSHDRVEPSLGALDDPRAAFPGASGLPGIPLHDDDVPAGELERPCVNAREAELEHAPGSVPQQLEDPRRRGSGEGGRKSAHWYARYMTTQRTGKFLRMPYDWRRPTVARVKSRWWNRRDRRIFTPKSYGWGYDVNFYEVARRLGLRR